MKLGDGVEQAIHCMLVLSSLRPGGVLAAAALATYHGVSASYLTKHLQALAGAGLLDSIPGPKGGYRLARQPQAITLLDIVLALEGPQPAFRCTEIRQRGPDPLPQNFHRAPCGVSAAMLRAERAYRDELARTRLSDLFNDPASPLGAAIDRRSCAFLALNERHQVSTDERT